MCKKCCNDNCCRPHNPCLPACDPCRSQPSVLYCGRPIDCVGLRRGMNMNHALELIGDEICSLEQQFGSIDTITVRLVDNPECINGFIIQVYNYIDEVVVQEYPKCFPFIPLTGTDSDNLITGGLDGSDDFSDSYTDNSFVQNSYVLSLINNISFYFEVTREEVEQLVNNSELVPNATYKIVDADSSLYGGTGVFLRAIGVDKLENNGVGEFYNPLYWNGNSTTNRVFSKYMTGNDNIGYDNTFDFVNKEQVVSNNGAIGRILTKGVIEYVSGNWNASTSITGSVSGATATVSGFLTPSYTIGSKVVWGGKCWINVTGNIGNVVNEFSLSSDWNEIPFNTVDYYKTYDNITYDFTNDLIVVREDIKTRNIVKTSYKHNIVLGKNPIKMFQWSDAIEGVVSKGVINAKVENSLFNCLNSRTLYIQNIKITNNSVFDDNILLPLSTMSSIEIHTTSSFKNNIISLSNVVDTLLDRCIFENNRVTNSQNIRLNLNQSFLLNNTLHTTTSNLTYLEGSSIRDNSIFSSVLTRVFLKSFSLIGNNLFNSVELRDCELSGRTIFSGNNYSSVTVRNCNFFSSIFKDPIIISSKDIKYVYSNRLGNVDMPSHPPISISSATTLFNVNILKEVYTRPDGVHRLKYYDNTDNLVIQDLNS